jgi:hypothetical protein
MKFIREPRKATKKNSYGSLENASINEWEEECEFCRKTLPFK